MCHVWETKAMRIKFWYESLKRDNLEYLDVVGRLILKWIFKKWDGRMWAGFM
jgi:hypothetical protein